MEGDVSQIPTPELESRIKELETSYAECLFSNEDSHTLHRIWKRIQEMQMELRNRQSTSGN